MLMSEKYTPPNANGDDHVWTVEFKWSCWTEDEEIWIDRAPGAYKMLVDMFAGYGEETGEDLVIHTLSLKKGTRAEVRFEAEDGEVRARVAMVASVGDDDSIEIRSNYLVDSLETALQLVDEVEIQLNDAERKWTGRG